MEPDEHLYEAAAKELASSPRTGLLAKCMAKCGGDENKAKARYIEVRVGEMKGAIKAEAKRCEEEVRRGQEPEPPSVINAVIFVLLVVVVITIIAVATDR